MATSLYLVGSFHAKPRKILLFLIGFPVKVSHACFSVLNWSHFLSDPHPCRYRDLYRIHLAFGQLLYVDALSCWFARDFTFIFTVEKKSKIQFHGGFV